MTPEEFFIRAREVCTNDERKPCGDCIVDVIKDAVSEERRNCLRILKEELRCVPPSQREAPAWLVKNFEERMR